ncbi:MAG TPA: hypothetical protein ENK85_01080, partial [Saprospiraceae bacterium]|nr:hypothetical protein [Saprospiraceae bacterium]
MALISEVDRMIRRFLVVISCYIVQLGGGPLKNILFGKTYFWGNCCEGGRVFGLWCAASCFWSLVRSKLLLVFGAQQAAFGLWCAASCFWSLVRSKLLLVFGAQQAAFGLWCAASCFWSL